MLPLFKTELPIKPSVFTYEAPKLRINRLMYSVFKSFTMNDVTTVRFIGDKLRIPHKQRLRTLCVSFAFYF